MSAGQTFPDLGKTRLLCLASPLSKNMTMAGVTETSGYRRGAAELIHNSMFDGRLLDNQENYPRYQPEYTACRRR